MYCPYNFFYYYNIFFLFFIFQQLGGDKMLDWLRKILFPKGKKTKKDKKEGK